MTKKTRPELVLSNSQIGVYHTCPKMYQHKYGYRVDPIKRPIYFVVGSAVHKFLELWYQTQDVKLAINAAMAIFDEVDMSLYDEKAHNNFLCDREMVAGICEAYPRYYSGDFELYQKFIAEGDTTIDLLPNHTLAKIRYRAILDLLCQDAAGDWWIMETKTAAASTVSPAYFMRVRIDSQVSGQMWVARSILGHFPKGVIYNVIKKPGIRLKKGEAPRAYRQRVFQEYSNVSNCNAKGYFTREEIIIGKRQLKEWRAETEFIASEIAFKRNAAKEDPDGTFWPKNTGACTNFNSACAYMPACIDGEYNRLLYAQRP